MVASQTQPTPATHFWPAAQTGPPLHWHWPPTQLSALLPQLTSALQLPPPGPQRVRPPTGAQLVPVSHELASQPQAAPAPLPMQT